MERGADLNELVRSGGTTTLSFEFEDKMWEVNYRSVPWSLRFNAIENAWKERKTLNDQGEMVADVWFDTAQYYEEVLMAAIADINGQKVTLPLLRTFDSPVITNLTKIVPGPSLLTDLATAKKELSPSDAGT